MLAHSDTAAGRAYLRLRDEILNGVLLPGQILFEVEQGVRLGVSRTPVREAFRQLVAEGLLEASGARGLVVTGVSPADLEAIFEFRSCLEAKAAELAARGPDADRFTAFAEEFEAAQLVLEREGGDEGTVKDYYLLIRRFDEAVDVAARNAYLRDALATLRTHAARVRGMARNSRTRLAASAREHAAIARAIAAHDGPLAIAATHVHLHNSLTHFRTALPGPQAALDSHQESP